MQREDYFVALVPNDIRLKRHRIGIETILYEYVHRGLTPDAIAEAFDTLTTEGSLRDASLLSSPSPAA